MFNDSVEYVFGEIIVIILFPPTHHNPASNLFIPFTIIPPTVCPSAWPRGGVRSWFPSKARIESNF